MHRWCRPCRRRKIQLPQRIYKQGIHFANVSIDQQYIIYKGINNIPLKIKFKVTDPLSLLSIGFDYKKLQKSDFTINFEATIKSGPIKKTFKFTNIPFSELGPRMEKIIQ